MSAELQNAVFPGLKDRVVIVTGAGQGIGRVLAKSFAKAGACAVIAELNEKTATVVSEEILKDGGQALAVTTDVADESSIAEMVDVVEDEFGRIDVLINNAGGTSSGRAITAEGNEATFAGNHLGHFVLTERLLPLLRNAAADSPPGATRIINVSSLAHEHSAGLDWSDIQLIDNFATGPAYCNAKLANVYFARALAQRLAGDGIVVHAVHPGAIATNFASHGDAGMQEYYRVRTDLLTPEQGADTLIWLATASEPGECSGLYYHERKAVPVSPIAQDADAPQKLWRESERLVAKTLG